MQTCANSVRVAIVLGTVIATSIAGCNSAGVGSVDGELALGTWGGNDAGVIVSDSLTHVHIGCTYGDIAGRVTLDSAGRFSVAGSYLLRAYPVAVGPTMPARFNGIVAGASLTFTVTVTDTVTNMITTVGPATVVIGQEPQMGPCPICQTPGDQARMRRRAASARTNRT